MAKRLSAKQRLELAALLQKKKLTDADKERLRDLTAGECARCDSDVTPDLVSDNLANQNVSDVKAGSQGSLSKVTSSKK